MFAKVAAVLSKRYCLPIMDLANNRTLKRKQDSLKKNYDLKQQTVLLLSLLKYEGKNS